MSLLLSKIKGNRMVYPVLVTFGYLLVTMKNSISNSIIVYSNSIGNQVTTRIWSHDRTHKEMISNIFAYIWEKLVTFSKKFVFSGSSKFIKGNYKKLRFGYLGYHMTTDSDFIRLSISR